MSLSARLQNQLRSEFFRPLSRASSPVYIDIADELLEAADEGGQLTREDTLTIIRDVVASLPSVPLEEDEGASFVDIRQRATQLYSRMIEAGWLQERPVNVGEYWVLVTPSLRMLVRLLHDLATSELSELKDFAASLRSICETLLTNDALNPARMDGESMRQSVKDLLDRTTRAGDQMHAVETLILRQEQRQRMSATAGETLNRLLVDFHAGEHMVCYDSLQEGGLIPRLHEARRVVQEASSSALAKQRLAEGIANNHSRFNKTASADAFVKAEEMLRRLDRGLGAIPAKQRIIDGRMADFSRLSAQRYRYQTEMRGRRPEQVKEYLEEAGKMHAGKRFADLEHQAGMPLLCPQVGIHFGAVSFAPTRRMRSPVNLAVELPMSEEDAFTSQEIIRKHNLLVITPQRAVRLLDDCLPEKGSTISTSELRIRTNDDFLDLLALLAFESAAIPSSRRSIRWRVVSPRKEQGLEPESVPADELAGWKVDRTTIERLS